jgi:hypothetical protein
VHECPLDDGEHTFQLDLSVSERRNYWFVLSVGDISNFLTFHHSEATTVRLVDAVFAVISEGVQDIAPSVRTVAAALLGTLNGTTPSLILQAFSKKVFGSEDSSSSLSRRKSGRVVSASVGLGFGLKSTFW